MSDRASEFLEAHKAIEANLRRRTGRDKHASFASLVSDAAKQDRLVDRYSKDLSRLNDLRNVIVHEHKINDEPIADPRIETVNLICTITAKLTNPPRVDSLFRCKVSTCRVDEMVGKVAGRMLAEDLSALPVADEAGSITELFTASTIARWFGSTLDVDYVPDATVRDALTHTEDPNHLAFISRESTSADAIAAFDKANEKGVTLVAIVITENGKPGSALGIITPFDIPKLHKSLAA